MRHRPVLLSLLALLGGFIGAFAGGDETGDAATLTSTTFEGHLASEQKEGRPVLVMFHVNWCKVCQKTFPKFATASTLVKTAGFPMSFAHVDCTSDKTLCSRFAVKGYPTIKLFSAESDVEPRPYKSPRTEEGFTKYAERMTSPAVRAFGGAAELERLMKGEAYAAFVAVAATPEQAPEGFVTAAEAWRDRHLFAATPKLQDLMPTGITAPADATLAAVSLGAHQQWPGADNTSQPGPAALFFTGDLSDAEAVTKWIEKHRFPGIWNLGETNFFEFTHATRRAVLLAVDPAAVTQRQERTLQSLSKKLKDDYIFGVVDGTSWADALHDFNIAKKDLPRVLITEDDFEAWYEDIEQLTMDNLEADLRGFAAGEKAILRQGRGALARLMFYKRELWRYAIWLHSYSMKGPTEALLAFARVVALVFGVMAVGYCAMACCNILLMEEEEELNPRMVQKKRD